MTAPVVLVHGAFCGGWTFDAFRQPFERAGHTCIAPDLPGRGKGESPTGLSMSQMADAVAAQIAALAEPPIVIGHSLGGLVAQMAAARAPVRGLILLAPAAPWGIAAASMEEAAIAIGVMSMGGPMAGVIEPNTSLFDACSLDRVSPETRATVLSRMVPESGRALWETFNWWLDPFMTTQVRPLDAPCLAIVGQMDRVCPAASVRQIAARLGGSLQVMPGMSHWLIGEPGWEDVAARCLAWMDETATLAA